jgi:exopolysaccharide biosynthesis protein
MRRTPRGSFIRILAVAATAVLLAPLHASVSTPYTSDGRNVIGPGVTHDRGTFHTTTSGRQAAHIVEVDVHDPAITLEASLSNDRVAGLEMTSAQANRKNREGHRAVAAINADFWGSREAPIGLHIENGELMTDGTDARPTFGVKPGREVMLASVDVNTRVTRPDGVAFTARRVNQSRSSGDLVVYTTRFAATTGTDSTGTEVILSGVALPLAAGRTLTGTVAFVKAGGDSPISPSDVILSGSGAASTFLAALRAGDTVTLTTTITAGWESVTHAAGGGHWIVRNGAISPVPDPGFADVTHPRSAIGLTASGDVILATVDGRQPGYSVGVRLDELAELMISRGAVTAVNLDGGGSTTMAVRQPGDDGVVAVNRGSDGFERPVSNSIIVFSTAPTGALARLNVLPSSPTIFQGSSVPFSVKGQDASYNKVAVDPSSVGWSLSNPSIGTIDSAGRLATSAPGTSEVRASVGSLTGSSSATVVDTLQNLRITPSPAVVPPRATFRFSLSGTSATGAPTIVENRAASWLAVGPIGTISNDGVLSASVSGSGTVRATADGASATATVDVGRPPLILEDFEDVSDMRALVARATASLTFSMRPNPVRNGTRAGWLTYNFTNQPAGTSAAYAAHNPLREIPDRPLRIGLWVYGDGSRHWLRGNYRDGLNAQKTIDFTAAATPAPVVKADCRNRSRGIDWIGWKYVEAAIPAEAVLPLKWERIYVVETSDLCDDSSALFFDDLRAVYSDTGEDLVGPEVSNVFPANGKRVYTSRPEIGGSVRDPANGRGVAPESVRLTLDNAQVPATFDALSGLVRYVPPAPLADGTHQVKLEAEDLAGNPALPFGQWSFIVYTGPDTDAPVVDRQQPLNGTTSKAGRPRISARIQDEYKGVNPASIQLSIDGAPVSGHQWDAQAGVVWYAPPVAMSNGAHTVTLSVADRETNPNIATSTWSFHVDAIPAPTSASAEISWLADGGYYEGTRENAPTQILAEHLAREKANPSKLLIFGGDIVENDQQINYDRAVAALASTAIPTLVAAGNHEISGSLSRNRFWRTFGPTIAAHDFGSADILILDMASSSLAWDTSMVGWLSAELARSDAPSVFIVLHVPTRDPFGSGHGLPPSEGALVESILARAKAARPSREIVVLSGDAHAYRQWTQDGVVYVISGGAGGGLDAVPAAGGFYHRLRIRLDGSSSSPISVVPLLESIAVAPASVNLNGGDSQLFAAGGDFFTASAANIVLPIAEPFARKWTSSDPERLSIGAQSGSAEAWIPGNVTVTIESGDRSQTAAVTIGATLAGIRRLLDRAEAEGAIEKDGTYHSLSTQLSKAEEGQKESLNAFLAHLRAQRGKKVAEPWATRLIENAEWVEKEKK